MRIVMAAIVSIALAPAAAAQPGLDSVRELYASADYEGVLSALGQLSTDRLVQRDSRELTRYRVLCLVALERTVEAERAMEEMLMRDPLYSISAAEASPRVVDAFAAVRRRTLPTVARTLYQDGRAAYGRKAFAEAVERLETTIRLIDNPDGADDPDLADLKTLASGFLDLSRTALAQAAPPPLPSTKLTATNASRPAPRPATKAAIRSSSDRICRRGRGPPPAGCSKPSSRARSKSRLTNKATSSTCSSWCRFIPCMTRRWSRPHAAGGTSRRSRTASPLAPASAWRLRSARNSATMASDAPGSATK